MTVESTSAEGTWRCILDAWMTTQVTVSFQDDVAPTAAYQGTRDATIAEDRPAMAHGAQTYLNADGAEPNGTTKDAHVLLRWDVSAIPPGSQVEPASLAIYVTDECAGQQYQLFAVTRAWDEAQVTWTAAAAGATWQTAGGDRSTAILASIAPTGTGAISVPFVAQAVQAWVDDPAQNFGLVMLGDANLNGVDLASREAQDPSRHPRLTVTYR